MSFWAKSSNLACRVIGVAVFSIKGPATLSPQDQFTELYHNAVSAASLGYKLRFGQDGGMRVGYRGHQGHSCMIEQLKVLNVVANSA